MISVVLKVVKLNEYVVVLNPGVSVVVSILAFVVSSSVESFGSCVV